MTSLTLTFPHPDRALSPNGQVPLKAGAAKAVNLKKVALKKATREAAYLTALRALTAAAPQRAFVPAAVSCDWVYKGMKPDLDNVVARLKPLIDGCCRAFGCDDRELELGRVRRIHSLGSDAGTLKLTFTTLYSECKTS